jgi:hypothetical protein
MAIPGLGASASNAPSEFRLCLHGSDTDVGITVSAAAVDAGNTPVTTLRKGLVLGRIAESGTYKEYDPEAEDGSETAALILVDEVDLLQDAVDGATPRDQLATGMQHGVVDESKLIGCDAAAKAALDNVIFM